MKKLSIIVPVFNVGLYLQDCIESLLASTYPYYEIILVDDGSTDDCPIICDNYAERFEFIHVIHKKNGGLPSARNAGLSVAEGYYISFVDSDDLVDRDMFKILIEKIEQTNSQVAICNFVSFNRTKKFVSSRYRDEVIEFNNNQTAFYKAAMDSSCNRVFVKEFIVSNNIYFVDKNVVPQEDFYFQVRLFTKIDKIVTTISPLYQYRQRKSSITKSNQELDFSKKCLAFSILTKEYIENNSERKPTDFYSYQFANLLLTSLNYVGTNSVKKLKSIIVLFMSSNDSIRFSSKVRFLLFPDKDIRSLYYRILLFLINIKLYTMASLFESVRIKRIRSQSNEKDYYL